MIPRPLRFRRRLQYLSAALLLSIAASAAIGCQGMRVFVDSKGRGSSAASAEESGPRADYWVLYQDWRIAHRDLLRDLETHPTHQHVLEGRFDDVQLAFGALAPHVPPDAEPELQRLASEYRDVGRTLRVGGNPTIASQRLIDMERAIRERFHPDRLAAEMAAVAPETDRPAGESHESDPSPTAGDGLLED